MIMVMIMKIKFLFPLVLAIIVGFFSAKIVYGLYNNNENNDSNCYFLQYGAYSSEKSQKAAVEKLEVYLSEKKDDKYYVYVGMTTNMANANKIKKIYNDKGIELYVKEVLVDNQEFYSNLEQFDILINGVSKDEDIISISEVILSSYEEMVLSS